MSNLHRFRLFSTVLGLLALVALSASAVAQGADRFQPKSTYVMVIGLLEWQDAESFAPFPKENRRDAELVTTLQSLGVPKDQIVYLSDKRATTASVRKSLTDLAQRVPENGTIMIYFCGHGYKDEDSGEFLFALYDTTDDRTFSGDDLLELIYENFEGDRVWLTVDCCYSGALARMAREEENDITIAVTASASAEEESTGNWTFTDALIAALKGEPYVDHNQDGIITLQDLTYSVSLDMQFAEDQGAESFYPKAFPGTFILSDARKSPHARVGQRVVVSTDGDEYKARIIDYRNGKFRVRYFGYDSEDDEWITETAIVSVWRGPKS
jgi:hypothetical protein